MKRTKIGKNIPDRRGNFKLLFTTVDALMKLELPSGVEVEIKV